MNAWSRILATLLTLALLFQTAEGAPRCAECPATNAAVQASHAHQHGSQAATHQGHRPGRHSCAPMDGSECLSMSSCAPVGFPVAGRPAFSAAPKAPAPLSLDADAPALQSLTPESPPPRA